MVLESYESVVYREYKNAWDAIAKNSDGRLDLFTADQNSEEIEDVVKWIRENMAYAFRWENHSTSGIFKFCAAPLGCPLNWLTHDERIEVLGAYLVPDCRDPRSIGPYQEKAKNIVERAVKRQRIMTERNDAFQILIYTDQRSTTPRVQRQNIRPSIDQHEKGW